MGVKERQEREREAVSRSILDAARDLFVAEGYHNVSIRKIAERIEYSPAAIYSYFPSKDDIFFALAEEGFHLLFSARPMRCRRAADMLEGLRRSFWRVYEFSKSHPEYFALMFVDRTVPRINKDWERFGFVREMKAQIGAPHPARDRRRALSRRIPAGRHRQDPVDGHLRRRGRAGCASAARRAKTSTRSRATRSKRPSPGFARDRL